MNKTAGLLTIEQKQVNFKRFKEGCAHLGFETDADALLSVIGEKLMEAPFSDNTQFGIAYEGSLLNETLNNIIPNAIKINELLPETIRADKNSLMKVLLLMHVAKALQYVPQTEDWKKKKGMMWEWTNYDLALRTGERSYRIAHNAGIDFSDAEYEAMVCLDKPKDDKYSADNCSSLTTVVRMANDLMWHIHHRQIINLQNKIYE